MLASFIIDPVGMCLWNVVLVLLALQDMAGSQWRLHRMAGKSWCNLVLQNAAQGGGAVQLITHVGETT